MIFEITNSKSITTLMEFYSYHLSLMLLVCLCSRVAVTTDFLQSERRHNASLLLDQLLLGYNKMLRPNFGGPPELVDVNMNIRSMGPISEMDMAYQIDLYFLQSWVDHRLRFSGQRKTLGVSVNILERLWKPDTHFFNGKKSYLHTVTTPNKLLRINQDGRILYSMRLTIKASCPMHLENFPMDTQHCPLKLGSHGYSISDVQYIWTHGASKSIKMASDMRLSQFDLIKIPAGNETLSQPHGQYSLLYANFALRRHTGYFLINVYVPLSLLVVISWVGFWINREATADRIALGITTVLTMAFLGIETRRDLPKVSYSTALDHFLNICFAFVMASIIQFAGVHFFTKHGSGETFPESDSEEEDPQLVTRTKERLYIPRSSRGLFDSSFNGRSNGQTDSFIAYESPPLNLSESCCTKLLYCLRGSSKYRDMKMRLSIGGINSVSKVDRLSRFLFPLAFLVFHILYWTFYLRQGE